jgi:[histone H3]-lysine36 N-dimethyltransferase SETMAR
MTTKAPTKEHLREVLLFMFNWKKGATEAHRMILEVYDQNIITARACQKWFKRFKEGDFDLDNKDRGRPPKQFEDDELQSLLDEDDAQTQQQLADSLGVYRSTISLRLSAMGKVQKEGKWDPHELTEQQQKNRRTTCEILLGRQQRKSFMHRIITGDEKWLYFDNLKRKRSWTDPGKAPKLTPKPNIHGKKVLLCIWWDQKGILYYELLQPGQTVTADLYKDQLLKLNEAVVIKRPEWATRHERPILLHDNARPHVGKQVKDVLQEMKWEVLPHPPYSPDIAPSDYHLFRSMAHGLAEQRFTKQEDVQKWLDEWIASKQPKFFFDGIHKLPINWNHVVVNNGNYS